MFKVYTADLFEHVRCVSRCYAFHLIDFVKYRYISKSITDNTMILGNIYIF